MNLFIDLNNSRHSLIKTRKLHWKFINSSGNLICISNDHGAFVAVLRSPMQTERVRSKEYTKTCRVLFILTITHRLRSLFGFQPFFSKSSREVKWKKLNRICLFVRCSGINGFVYVNLCVCESATASYTYSYAWHRHGN